ncbi:MAG TPA: hypothetical protein VGB53_00885 [Rubricoccaceae bacterium]|jgi:hypothetical protein
MLYRFALLVALAAGLTACDSEASPETSSAISTSYFPLFEADFGPPGRTRTATFPMAAITEDVNRRGVVLAQIDLEGGERGWTAMPLTVIEDSVVAHFGYRHRVGEVTITYAADEPGSFTRLAVNHTVKVVAVSPDAVGAASARAAVAAGRPAAAATMLGLD